MNYPLCVIVYHIFIKLLILHKYRNIPLFIKLDIESYNQMVKNAMV